MQSVDAVVELFRRISRRWAPPPRWTVSQWADNRRMLPSESSAEPGRWDTARAEYQRGIMDAVCDPAIERVVVKSSAQVGKSEVILNTVGYYIDFDPSPIMVVYPTTDLGESFSKDRIAPMLRDTPTLREKCGDPKARDTGSSIRRKAFPGGHLTIAGANSPSDLAGRPIRIVLFDEVDRYPASAGNEGDPVALGEKRTTTFWNAKKILVSTPTTKGLSRIGAAYDESDRRVYEIRCPHCEHPHVLAWGNVVFDKADVEGTARMKCPSCARTFTNAEKNVAVMMAPKQGAGWRATAPFTGTAGFHINELYSPWKTIAQVVKDFLAAKDFPERLKVWINTSLGEEWDEADGAMDGNALAKRAEKYAAPVPGRVLTMVFGADTQPDRIEAELVGFGAGEESWSIDHAVFWGDPDIVEGRPGSPWDAFTAWRRKLWQHETAGKMPIWGGCIDSGGHNTEAVYNYCRGRRGERVFAVKGVSGEDKALVSAAQRKRVGKQRRPVDLFLVAVDQVKSIVYRRLRIDAPGAPGYCHFPTGRPPEWFEQLVAEKAVVEKDRKGYKKRVWKLPEGKRNEALDCRVYAFAALVLAKPDFSKLALGMKKRREAVAQVEAEEQGDDAPEVAPDKPPVAPIAPPVAPERAPPEEIPAQDAPAPPAHTRPRPVASRPRRRGGYVSAW
jgi:phage terminase large subunit GpA-like protein